MNSSTVNVTAISISSAPRRAGRRWGLRLLTIRLSVATGRRMISDSNCSQKAGIWSRVHVARPPPGPMRAGSENRGREDPHVPRGGRRSSDAGRHGPGTARPTAVAGRSPFARPIRSSRTAPPARGLLVGSAHPTRFAPEARHVHAGLRSANGVEFERTASGTSSSSGARRRSPTSASSPRARASVHQVNLEHLAKVVMVRDGVARPRQPGGDRQPHDHDQRPGRGRVGRGRDRGRGVHARPAIYMVTPEVVGFKLTASCPRGRRPPTWC